MRRLAVVFLAFALAGVPFGCGFPPSPPAVTQDVPFMDLNELRQRMSQGSVWGTFVTVTSGSERVSKSLRIEGLLEEGAMRMVVFTTHHYIAAGMSGSPVYITGADGKVKLLGALSYFLSPSAAGSQWGGITLIQDMRMEAGKMSGGMFNGAPSPQVAYKGKTFVPIALGNRSVPEELFASGKLDDSGLEFLKANKFMMYGGTAGGPVVQPTYNQPLEPGMPIVVDLLELTDPSGKTITISAMGTVTYVSREGTVYAFGHPFLGARDVRYRFRTGKVLGTVESHDMSFKLPGEHSPVLGVIAYDGAYGIYGRVDRQDTAVEHPLKISFRRNGGEASEYKVEMARTPYRPQLTAMVMEMLGEHYGSPMPTQASTTGLKATVPLEGYKPVTFGGSYSSNSFQFGPKVVYRSSFQNAYEDFMARVYLPLSNSSFGFKIPDIALEFDFSDGIKPSLKLAAVRFPEKVRFGSTPVLEILLVSQDNKTAMSRSVPVTIDWSQVEEPTYTAETKNTEKQDEKIVGGAFTVYTAEHFATYLSENEKERVFPAYFLNAQDCLEYFKRTLARNNKVLFARVAVRKRTGQTPEPADQKELSLTGPRSVQNGWTVSRRGLSERRVTVHQDGALLVTLDMPEPPGGYTIASSVKSISFEVVK